MISRMLKFVIRQGNTARQQEYRIRGAGFQPAQQVAGVQSSRHTPCAVRNLPRGDEFPLIPLRHTECAYYFFLKIRPRL
jgi:hypothetical protein